MPLSALESVCQHHASAELPFRVRELLFVASKEGFFEAEPSELDFAADVALRQTGFGNFSEMQKKDWRIWENKYPFPHRLVRYSKMMRSYDKENNREALIANHKDLMAQAIEKWFSVAFSADIDLSVLCRNNGIDDEECQMVVSRVLGNKESVACLDEELLRKAMRVALLVRGMA